MIKWLMYIFSPMTIGFSGSAGLYLALATTVVSAGSAIHSAKQQDEANDEAEKQAKLMEAQAQERELGIFNQQAEDAKNSRKATVEFGGMDNYDEMGSYDDFISSPSPTTFARGSGLSKVGSTGLGL